MQQNLHTDSQNVCANFSNQVICQQLFAGAVLKMMLFAIFTFITDFLSPTFIADFLLLLSILSSDKLIYRLFLSLAFTKRAIKRASLTRAAL